LEHRSGLIKGFTRQYSVTALVYFEECGEVEDAIAREKQIKGWRRSKKLALIESLNPRWADLADGLSEDAEGEGPRAVPSRDAEGVEGLHSERDPSLRSG
jgi:hypothetical protein